MTTSVETLKNYDYKAPVWGNDAKVTAKAKKMATLRLHGMQQQMIQQSADTVYM